MKGNKKRILIATGIYPPAIGGPAEYAYQLEKIWKNEGYKVTVKYFGAVEKFLPTGLRHLYFLIKSKWAFFRADYILVLDTWSVALPIAILSFFFRKKFIIRTGGDFLWESYVDRTGKKVLFKDFYKNEVNNLNKKERLIFKITRWVLYKAEKIVFSTEWQKNIWKDVYNIPETKTLIIENFYEQVSSDFPPKNKIFLASVRDLVWKNTGTLKNVFLEKEIRDTGFILDTDVSGHSRFLDRIKDSYAVILVSLGDISPNMILDAIRYGKPFIVTKEIGIYDRVKDIALFVDPLDEQDIKNKVLWLSNEDNYKKQVEKIKNFNFSHTFDQIAKEFLNI